MRYLCASIYIFLCLFLYCIAPLVLQTEALQVLTALPRFYFPQLGSSWVRMGEVCVSLLTKAREGLQQHLLRVRCIILLFLHTSMYLFDDSFLDQAFLTLTVLIF